MNSIKFFLYFALCFFGVIWLFNFHKINQLEERYNKALQEHERLLTQDSINQCIFDSLQYQLDSLHLRYQIFDSAPGRDFIDIMNAIIQVESRGNPQAYAPGEDAVGVLQIRKCMVDDVNRILKRKGSIFRYTYNDRWDINKSYEMFQIFCEYYNLDTAEDMARGWNGGPRGIDKPSTLGYWEKVKEEINS
jgi:hypothetical protein